MSEGLVVRPVRISRAEGLRNGSCGGKVVECDKIRKGEILSSKVG